MTIEIDRGFKKLAEVASLVQGDKEKAKRVKEKLREVKEFLGKEGLLIDKPQKLIKEARDREWDKKYERQQGHLAAVVQEALQIEDGNFKHSKIVDVVRALRKKMADGSDPRLIPTYSDSTLTHHVWHAGITLDDAFPRNDFKHFRMRLVSLVALDDFSKIVPSRGWRETLQYASQILPKDTNADAISAMLIHLPIFGKIKSVSERLNTIYNQYPSANPNNKNNPNKL